MELQTIGIETVFPLVGLSLCGEVVVRKKYSRKTTAAIHGEGDCGGSRAAVDALRTDQE